MFTAYSNAPQVQPLGRGSFWKQHRTALLTVAIPDRASRSQRYSTGPARVGIRQGGWAGLSVLCTRGAPCSISPTHRCCVPGEFCSVVPQPRQKVALQEPNLESSLLRSLVIKLQPAVWVKVLSAIRIGREKALVVNGQPNCLEKGVDSGCQYWLLHR